mgnify:CR=1 FL=1
MNVLELRNKLIDYVNDSDELLLQRVLNFIQNEKEVVKLPKDVLKSLDKAEEDIKGGRIYSHNEVMESLTKKYDLKI